MQGGHDENQGIVQQQLHACKDEYDLYKEWTQVTEARPRYINIMYGWINDEDERVWNNDD